MFQAVAQAGGFSQAADRIHKSQSTIHHGVQKLEESLGLKLFETEGRKVQLTDEGKLMLRRAGFVLEEAAKVEALAVVLGEGVETELNIAVDHAFPYEWVYEALNRVTSEYAMLCINLHETSLSGSNELLLNGEVNLGISPFMLPECLNEALCDVTFVAVAKPSHALHALERELELEDLKSHRQIVVRDSAKATERNEGWLGSEQRWTVDHMRTSVDLVSRGFGFAWLPEPLCLEYIESGKLKALPLGARTQRNVTFYLNFLDADRLGPAARSFLGELRYLTPDRSE